MDNIPHELLLKIASESQFTWRPLSCVNTHITKILRQYNMYDYISGPVFICFNPRNNINELTDDIVYLGDLYGLLTTKQKYRRGRTVHILYEWEKIREYTKINSLGSNKWIIDNHMIDHFRVELHSMLGIMHFIQYHINGQRNIIICEDHVQPHRGSFDELCARVPNLKLIHYIMEFDYIPC